MNKNQTQRKTQNKLNQEHMHIVLESNGEYKIVNYFVFGCTLSLHSNESMQNFNHSLIHKFSFQLTNFLFNSQIFFSTHRAHVQLLF